MTLAEQLSDVVVPTKETEWSEAAKLAAAARALHLPEVLSQLKAAGWQPSIAYTWRSLATQAVLRAAGYTQVSFSLHNVTDAAGRPAAYAADIFDRRYGYSKPEPASRFFKALGAVATGLGLDWGGNWSHSDPHWSPYDLGWDPGHIQLAGYRDIEPLQVRCLPLLLGPAYVARFTDGYIYRVWTRPNGATYIEIFASPKSKRRALLLPGVNDAAISRILQQIATASVVAAA